MLTFDPAVLAFDHAMPRYPQTTPVSGGVSAGSARMGADPVLTARTAGVLLALARDLGGTARSLLDRLDLPDQAYGPASAGPALAQAHQRSVGDVQDILDRLVTVLEGDGDRLYRIAFAVEEADRAAVGRLRLGTGAAALAPSSRRGLEEL